MNNFDRVLKILQEDTSSTSDSFKLLQKILTHKNPVVFLKMFNGNFPLTDSSGDVERIKRVLDIIKLNESKVYYDDYALTILNRIAEDKDDVKKQLKIIEFLREEFDKLPNKNEDSLGSLYSKLIGKFRR